MAVRGIPSEQSITLVSGDPGDLIRIAPRVSILAPYVLGAPQQLSWSIGFSWDYIVRNFTLDDIELSGDDTGVTLTMFSGGDGLYSAILTLPANAHGSLNISVQANAADGNGTSGPEASVGETIVYDTRPKPEPPGIICRRTQRIDLNRDISEDPSYSGGGVYRNIFSAAKLGDYIYFVCQIQRQGGLFGRTTPSTSGILTFLDDGATFFIAAGAVLYRMNVTNCQFEIIKRYDNITFAARSLVAINGRIYGFEGSHYNHINDGQVRQINVSFSQRTLAKGSFDTLKGARFIGGDETLTFETIYKRSRFRDVPDNWRKQCGNLISISNDESELTSHGIWTSAEPIENPHYNQDDPDPFYGIHTGTASPIVGSDDDIRLITGYGNYSKVVSADPEEETQRYGNIAWLQFDTELKRRMPVLRTNNRTAYDIIREIARLTNSIISFDGDTFVLKPRDTEAAAQYTLDLNAYTLEQPIDDITPYTDRANRYNAVAINYGDGKTFRKQTPTANGEGVKEYPVDTELGEENIVWIKWLADTFLARFSVTRHIVVVQLKPSPHLKLGDIVEINAAERVHITGRYQLIEVSHFLSERRTETRFVSL